MSSEDLRPRVSVIVPNYMHGRFLEERIQSVLCQSFQDFEIILLDDASTDNSKDIIENYRANPKVTHVHFNETNSGKPFLQWKQGMKLAQGALVWIAESDDVAKPEFLKAMVQAFDQYPDLVLATVLPEYIDKEGKVIGFVEEKFQGTYDGIEVLVNGLGYRNCIRNASAVVFDKQVGMAYIDCIIDRRYSGDWHFWALMAMHPGGRVHFSPMCLCSYRLHGSSVHGKVRGHRRALPAIEAMAIFCNINLHPAAAYSSVSTIRKFITLNDDIWFWIRGVPPNIALFSKLFFRIVNWRNIILLMAVLTVDVINKIINRVVRLFKFIL